MRHLALVVAVLLGLSCYESRERPLEASDFNWATEDLTSAALLEGGEGWLASAAGGLYRTTDSGETWRRVPLEPTAQWRAMAFADANAGWLLGHRQIWATRSAGEDWHAQSLPDSVEERSLSALAVLDRDRAILAGPGGLRLWTADGGTQWQRADRAATKTVPGDAGEDDRVALSCGGASSTPPEEIVCFLASGSDGFQTTRDGGRSWQPVQLAPPRAPVTISFDEGSAELSPASRKAVAELAVWAQARGAVALRVAPMASGEEVRRIGRERDPEALFEILEARSLDVRTLLEESGIAVAAIASLGEPPWGFADYLDDDPEFLDRYWESRTAPQGGVRVTLVDTAAPVWLDARLGLGLGSDGRLIAQTASDASWAWREPLGSIGEWCGLSAGRGESVEAVSASGQILKRMAPGETWTEAPGLPQTDEGEGAWRGLVHSPTGDWAIAFGDAGHLARRAGDSPHWTSVSDRLPSP